MIHAIMGGMGDVRDIDCLLEAAVPLMKKRRIESAALFGSFAKGTAHATSDIDIVAWPGEGWTVRDWDALQDDLEALPSLKKWDLVRMNGFVSPTLKEMIERDGVVLYGSPGQP